MKAKPCFLLCEDGMEYLDRFQRFLGERFEFSQTKDCRSLLAQLPEHPGACGILLDLDFRRIDVACLVDAEGRSLDSLTLEERSWLAANQGIAILAQLRIRCVMLPVLLFADIDDDRRRAFLLSRYAPLELIGSHVGLNELQQRLEILAGSH